MLEPMLYRLKVDKDKMHYLQPDKVCFEVPGKNYGSMEKNVELFHKAYNKTIGNMGVLLTGSAGTGKTRLAELLCNRCLTTGLPVVIVSEIRPTIDTIAYIGMLRNVVILFDEFGKNFNQGLQAKMLTMLSSVTNGKKFFILTENDTNLISSFILNRPGRIRYHLDFERVEEIVIDEYCSDYNVPEKIVKDIKDLYIKSPIFSFDHLQALVSEWLFTPEDSIDTLLERLNLSMLTNDTRMLVKKVFDKKTGEEYDFTINDLPTKKNFLKRYVAYISVSEKPPKPKESEGIKEQPQGFPNMPLQGKHIGGTNITKSHITAITDDEITLEVPINGIDVVIIIELI